MHIYSSLRSIPAASAASAEVWMQLESPVRVRKVFTSAPVKRRFRLKHMAATRVDSR